MLFVWLTYPINYGRYILSIINNKNIIIIRCTIGLSMPMSCIKYTCQALSLDSRFSDNTKNPSIKINLRSFNKFTNHLYNFNVLTSFLSGGQKINPSVYLSEHLTTLRCCFEIKRTSSKGLFYRNQLFQLTVCSAVAFLCFNTSESNYESISGHRWSQRRPETIRGQWLGKR